MALCNDIGIKILMKAMDREIEKEIKITRKKNTKWEEVGTYPCPCQCEAIRYITPRGKQQLFRTLRKVKTFLWFSKDVPVRIVYTSMPVYENGKYFWKQVKEEPYSASFHGKVTE